MMYRMHGHRCHGGILLETVVAMSIFVGIGTMVMSIMTGALRASGDGQLRSAAVDLAQTRMNQLAAGFINLEDLRGGTAMSERFQQDDQRTGGDLWRPMRIDIQTEVTEFHGLSLVVLRVYENEQSLLDSLPPLFQLQELIALRDQGESSFDVDPMIEADAGRSMSSFGGDGQ